MNIARFIVFLLVATGSLAPHLSAVAQVPKTPAPAARPAPAQGPADLLAARTRLMEATIAKPNASRAAALIDEQALIAGPDGAVDTKAGLLARVKGRKPAKPAEDVAVRTATYGSGAVVTAMRAVYAADGKSAAPERLTEAWWKGPGGWRLVAAHATTIVQPGTTAAPGSPVSAAPPAAAEKGKAAAGAPNADQQAVLDAWKELATAVANRDSAAYGRWTVDELTIVTPDGAETNRAARIADLDARKQSPKGTVAEIADTRVRIYGGMAVLTYRTVASPARFTTVWVKRDGRWQQAAAQVSNIR